MAGQQEWAIWHDNTKSSIYTYSVQQIILFTLNFAKKKMNPMWSPVTSVKRNKICFFYQQNMETFSWVSLSGFQKSEQGLRRCCDILCALKFLLKGLKMVYDCLICTHRKPPNENVMEFLKMNSLVYQESIGIKEKFVVRMFIYFLANQGKFYVKRRHLPYISPG